MPSCEGYKLNGFSWSFSVILQVTNLVISMKNQLTFTARRTKSWIHCVHKQGRNQNFNLLTL